MKFQRALILRQAGWPIVRAMANTPNRLPLLLLAGLLWPAALRAQAGPTVEERLQALEQQVQGLTQENAGLKKQLGWKDVTAPVLPRPGGNEAKLVVGGFLLAPAEVGREQGPRRDGGRDWLVYILPLITHAVRAI